MRFKIMLGTSKTRLVHGMDRVDFGPNLLASGGRWRDPKPIAQIHRFSWFRVQVVADRFGQWWELSKSAKCCWNMQKIVGFYKNSPFCLNFAESSQNLTRFGRDLTRSCWISLKQNLILLDLVYSINRVRWLGFWRRKPTTRLASVSSWRQKPAANWLDLRFGMDSGHHQAIWLGFRVPIESRHPYPKHFKTNQIEP